MLILPAHVFFQEFYGLRPYIQVFSTFLSYFFLYSIHFELIFLYSIRQWSSFTLLHVTVQFSQHYILSILTFPHCVFLDSYFLIFIFIICYENRRKLKHHSKSEWAQKQNKTYAQTYTPPTPNTHTHTRTRTHTHTHTKPLGLI